jgi:hypothetical protein
MDALTFETNEAWLTLEQDGAHDAALISLRLSLSSARSVYVSNGKTLQMASWTMVVGALAPADAGPGRAPGTLSYGDNDGKTECLLRIDVAPDRFCELMGMFKGGHASEIALEVGGMTYQDDYSSHWNTEQHPTLPVLRARFEFPLPQRED